MYISLDKITQQLEFNLPPGLEKHRAAAESAVRDEFAFEPFNRQVLKQMNLFLFRWFEKKGITLPQPPEGNQNKGDTDPQQ